MKRIRRLSATLIVLVLAAIPLAASATAFAALPGGDGLSLLTWVLAVVMGFLGLSAAFLKLLVQPTMEKMISDQREEMVKTLNTLDIGQRELLAKLNTISETQRQDSTTLREESTSLAEIDARLIGLEREHCLLHGSALKRRKGDPPDADPGALRGAG